ncbi:hypothetical protein HGRIS_005335 [Hohenbuehelia grisea]|uniref:Uncharacterized protein n=1 Tax=Hohenbuehelia grisea TaxID=104357 RepID=A0ABR3JEX1_9AGAR
MLAYHAIAEDAYSDAHFHTLRASKGAYTLGILWLDSSSYRTEVFTACFDNPQYKLTRREIIDGVWTVVILGCLMNAVVDDLADLLDTRIVDTSWPSTDNITSAGRYTILDYVQGIEPPAECRPHLRAPSAMRIKSAAILRQSVRVYRDLRDGQNLEEAHRMRRVTIWLIRGFRREWDSVLNQDEISDFRNFALTMIFCEFAELELARPSLKTNPWSRFVCLNAARMIFDLADSCYAPIGCPAEIIMRSNPFFVMVLILTCQIITSDALKYYGPGTDVPEVLRQGITILKRISDTSPSIKTKLHAFMDAEKRLRRRELEPHVLHQAAML